MRSREMSERPGEAASASGGLGAGDASGASGDGFRFKVIVTGDYAVGKTSLIKRYTEGAFTANYKITIGVDFALKTVRVADGREATLQLWDVAGHERFGTVTRHYFRYAAGGLVVFDASKPASFAVVLKWKDDIRAKVTLADDSPIPLLLLANKCDLPGALLDDAEMDRFVEEHGFLGWFRTSAKDNIGVDDAMGVLVEEIVRHADALRDRPPTDYVLPEAVDLGDGAAALTGARAYGRASAAAGPGGAAANAAHARPPAQCCWGGPAS